jgi:general secretion pathway protein I
MSVRNFNDDGFTLLEMMIALAIVSIALVSLLGLSNHSIMIQERLQRLTRGTLLAQQLISEEELTGGVKRDWQPREDVFLEPYGDFRWQVSYQDTLITNVKQVTVTVLWGDAARNEQIRLTSFLPVKEGG